MPDKLLIIYTTVKHRNLPKEVFGIKDFDSKYKWAIVEYNKNPQILSARENLEELAPDILIIEDSAKYVTEEREIIKKLASNKEEIYLVLHKGAEMNRNVSILKFFNENLQDKLTRTKKLHSTNSTLYNNLNRVYGALGYTKSLFYKTFNEAAENIFMEKGNTFFLLKLLWACQGFVAVKHFSNPATHNLQSLVANLHLEKFDNRNINADWVSLASEVHSNKWWFEELGIDSNVRSILTEKIEKDLEFVGIKEEHKKTVKTFCESLAKGKVVKTEVVTDVFQVLLLFNLNLIIPKRTNYQNRLIRYNHNWLPKKFLTNLENFIEKADNDQLDIFYFQDRGKSQEEKECSWSGWERNKAVFGNLIDGNISGKGQSLKYALNPFSRDKEDTNKYLPTSSWLKELCSYIWVKKNGIDSAVLRMLDLTEQINVHYKELKAITDKHELKRENYLRYADKFKDLLRKFKHLHTELILFENFLVYVNPDKRGELEKQYKEIFYPIEFKDRLSVLVIDDTTGGYTHTNGKRQNLFRKAFCEKLGLEDITGDLDTDIDYKATVSTANAFFLSGQDINYTNGKKTCRNRLPLEIVDAIIAKKKEYNFALIFLDLIFEEVENDQFMPHDSSRPFGYEIIDAIHQRQDNIGIPGIILSIAPSQDFKEETESSIFKSYESRITFTKKKLNEALLKYGLNKPETLLAYQRNVTRSMALSSFKLFKKCLPKDALLEELEDEYIYLLILYYVRRYEQMHNATSANRLISEAVFRSLTQEVREGKIDNTRLRHVIEDVIEEFEEKEGFSIAHLTNHPDWKLRPGALGIKKRERKAPEDFSDALRELQKNFPYKYFQNHTPADIEEKYEHLIQTSFYFALQLFKVALSKADKNKLGWEKDVFTYFFNQEKRRSQINNTNAKKELPNLLTFPLDFPLSETNTPELFDRLEKMCQNAFDKKENAMIKKFFIELPNKRRKNKKNNQ